MIRSDLPEVTLAELPGGPDPVVLCATARLATGLRRAHGELQAARGATTWQALQSSTPALWLEHLSASALLRGEIPPQSVPGTFLSWAQERSLWEQAIAQDTGAASELFDRDGMALAAMEAASLQRRWRIEVPSALHTEEFRAFLRWRDRVAEACRAGGWRTADETLTWRIDCIERGIDLLGVGDIALHSKKFRRRRGRVVRNGNAIAECGEMARACEANAFGSTCNEDDS